MELSANWKRLKATFSAEEPKKQLPKQSDHGKKILKRKQPPASVSRLGKKPKITRPSMDVDIATEIVNEGLSERYVVALLKIRALLNLPLVSKSANMLQLTVRWLVWAQHHIKSPH